MRGRPLLVGAALLLTACTSSGLSDPAPSPVRAEAGDPWTVELSTAPTLLVVGDSDVYAGSYGNGVGGSQVYRVDRATGVLEEQRTLAGQPNGMVLGPDGKLWVATLRLPDQPTGTGLQVLDSQTLETHRAVSVDEEPLSVTAVGTDVWVGSRSGVRRYDDATGTFGPLVPTTTPAYRMLAAGDALLVVGPGRVERFDARTGRALASAAVPASGSVGATANADRLWLTYADVQAASVLQRYDAASLEPVVAAPTPGRAGAGAVITEDALWIVPPDAAEVRCADPDSGAVQSARPAPDATGHVAADERQVFVALARGLAALPAEC